MLDHNRFEELASLAAIRELSPEEHEEFERHKSTCAECRELLDEMSLFAADLFLAGASRENGNFDEERHRRLRSAVSRQFLHAVPIGVVGRYRHLIPAGVAASFLLGAGVGAAVGYHVRQTNAGNVPPEERASAQSPTPRAPASMQNDAQLQAVVAQLQGKVEQAHRDVRALHDKLAASQGHGVGLQAKLDEVNKQSAAQAQELAQARSELATTQNQMIAARESALRSDATITSLKYQLGDRETRLAEATASVEREREMLSAGREIRDIMGARDLHIVDVIDRDGKGRARKAFGRAFYTQGKSLIFYAFDLPTKNTVDGKFVYAAWGSNSNNLSNKVMRSLGIFYNDDQTQHRWAMKFEDPKVLEEIDTVFVTLEPAGVPFSNPTGRPILEAYFGTPPNHP